MKFRQEQWSTVDEMITMGEINAGLPRFKAKRDAAIETCVREMRNTDGTIMVSVSGGKDSVAMIAIVDAAARLTGSKYFIWSHLSNASFPQTEETIRACIDLFGCDAVLDHSPVDAFEVVGRGSVQKFGKMGYFANAISNAYTEHGVSLSFVGVRAGESKRRSKAIQAKGNVFDTSTYGKRVRVVYPLAYFSVIDVFSLIAVNNLPLHPIYSKFNVGATPIRLGYVTALDLIDRDAAVFLKMNYPSLYNKLVKSYPDAGYYC